MKIKGTASRPRFSVFRSNRYIYAQLIDDESGKTLIQATSRELNSSAGANSKSKIEMAREVGRLIAKRAFERGLRRAIADRGPYAYHGRVKALFEGAREAGLAF